MNSECLFMLPSRDDGVEEVSCERIVRHGFSSERIVRQGFNSAKTSVSNSERAVCRSELVRLTVVRPQCTLYIVELTVNGNRPPPACLVVPSFYVEASLQRWSRFTHYCCLIWLGGRLRPHLSGHHAVHAVPHLDTRLVK